MAELSQGHFVGAVADNLGEEIDLKVFHAKTIVDENDIKADKSSFVDIPHFNAALFKDENGVDRTEEVIQNNYYKIRTDVKGIIEKELNRIGQDPNLKHLIKKKAAAAGQ